VICEGKTVLEITAVGSWWPERIRHLRPKNVVELGTGQGASGAQIMSALPPDSTFTTINYADGHQFGAQLAEYYFDPRLRRLDMDTLDPATLGHVPDEVDLLFIDTTHEAWHAAAELRLWQDRLQDGAVVIVDDLNQHDMHLFWDSLPYEKVGSTAGNCQGVFRYDASRRYEGRFDRPEETDYVGDRIRGKR
jgi:cephalosporin hydroxylase